MDIRQATDADIKLIIEIDYAPPEDEEWYGYVARAVQAQSVWIFVRDGQVHGFVIVEYSFFSQGFVSLLYTDSNHRRQGIGTALMQHVESICKTEKLFTSTNESNRPMHLLLAKSQFAPSGVVNNLDEGDPEIIYFKRIGKD